MSELDRPNATINYETWREGESGSWITLVNGHTRSLKDYRLMAKQFAADGFRVLALDNRGAGATVTTTDFTYLDLAGDVVALWDHLQIPQSHLLGISMGGEISQVVASENPERVNRLVLVSTTADDRWVIRANSTPWGNDLAGIEQTLSPYFSATFLAANQPLVKAMAKNILDQVKSGFITKADSQRRAFRDFNWVARLSEIGAVTLVVHGDQDRIIAPDAAEELAQLIPNARLKLIPGAGHLLLAETYKQLYSLAKDFFT